MDNPVEHRYTAASELTHYRKSLQNEDFALSIAQQPSIARVALGKDKDRKTISPPPVIKLSLSSRVDPEQLYMQSPYFFMTCSLLSEFDEKSPPDPSASLVGNLVSTVHKIKVKDLKDNKEDEYHNGSHESAYFVFADVSVKIEGRFRLQFNLFELKNFEEASVYIRSIVSAPFWVHSAKSWPGVPQSSSLTQVLSDQGVKLRIAKVPRTKKRGPASDDYQPRHYGTRISQSSVQSIEEESEAQREFRRSSDVRPDSIDQSYSQVHETAARGYFPGLNHYSQSGPHNDFAPRKRPRVSSIYTSVESFRQNSSVSSPQTPGYNSCNTIFEHSTYKYAESANEPLQGRYYDNTGMMVSPQATGHQDVYNNRAKVIPGFSQPYETSSQPAIINQQQVNHGANPLQYNISGPSANMQNFAFAPRNEHIEENDLYGYQSKSQSMILPSVTVPSSMGSTMGSSMGRTNTGEFGGYGNFISPNSNTRLPYQTGLGSNQPFSIENMTAAMIPSFQASTMRNTVMPRTIDQASYMRQPVTQAGMVSRYGTWNQSGDEEEQGG